MPRAAHSFLSKRCPEHIGAILSSLQVLATWLGLAFLIAAIKASNHRLRIKIIQLYNHKGYSVYVFVQMLI